MPTGDRDTDTTRDETDASLRGERAKTDRELAQRRAEVEEDADAVVGAARERADAVLSAVRQREEQKSGTHAAADGLAGEHARADAVIAKEREVADTVLEAERLERQVALAALLAVERHETDSRLHVERARADESVGTRDDLLASVSHDLRSLLGIVAMNAGMIDRQLQVSPSQIPRYSASIKRATAQMSRLVSDLLEVASFDAGKVVLLRERLDAGRIVQQVAEAFAAASSAKEIALSASAPDAPLLADFDPDRMGQVLTNLIGNALKFTATGGRISISLVAQGPDLWFSVADSGEGIPPEKLGTVFERYSQVSRSDQRGLGLGLHIARRIVEAHGGRIWVESKLGQGSTFFVSLPAAANEGGDSNSAAHPLS
jgi:signal transduction histidine kinase